MIDQVRYQRIRHVPIAMLLVKHPEKVDCSNVIRRKPLNTLFHKTAGCLPFNLPFLFLKRDKNARKRF